MAVIKRWNFLILIGGTARALDAIPIASLADGHRAEGIIGDDFYLYEFDAAATDAESSPDIIRPDDFGTLGAGVWKLKNLFNVYTTTNIVGTVSETAGVPTGAIIEYGSNANGDYTKFADGTMICITSRQSKAVTWASVGNIWRTGAVTIDFPAAFAISPTSILPDARSPSMWASTASTVTLADAICYFWSYTGILGTPQNIGITVIGRWFT